MATKIEVTQIRSGIGRPEAQRTVLKGLGLRGPTKQVVPKDTPAIRGMVLKVQHLVAVRVLEGEATLTGRRHRK